MPRTLLSGNEAIAAAALDGGVALGTGYPGTPSTEILENFDALGGRAQWAPNEKVALEVGLGAAYAGAAVLVTMKHVGVNVAADPLFTAAYTGVQGALVLISADDPGMASSQNEQDNRHFAEAAGVPMLEPADQQEAYDFTLAALELSHRYQQPVILRLTTRVCHTKSLVQRGEKRAGLVASFVRDIKTRVMIPAYARVAHRKLRQKLADMAKVNETSELNLLEAGDRSLGIITAGISYLHARETAPNASILKLGWTYPLPMDKIAAFTKSVDRCVVVEEGDPWLTNTLRAAGLKVDSKAEMYRFGELNVDRVRRIIANDTSPEPVPPRGKPPQLCVSCPYHAVYSAIKKLDLIVAGDIGCYTLGVLPPYEAMDACVCMGASLGVGLGLRHVLPEAQARRVVSVIGDSTFAHTGINGLMEMVYNAPKTGHVLLVLDNGTTAMTGQQEHPGTGRTLDHEATNKVSIEGVARAMGVPFVHVMDASADPDGFENLLRSRLASNELSVIITRKPCLLAAGKIKEYEKANAAKLAAHECSGDCGGCKH